MKRNKIFWSVIVILIAILLIIVVALRQNIVGKNNIDTIGNLAGGIQDCTFIVIIKFKGTSTITQKVINDENNLEEVKKTLENIEIGFKEKNSKDYVKLATAISYELKFYKKDKDKVTEAAIINMDEKGFLFCTGDDSYYEIIKREDLNQLIECLNKPDGTSYGADKSE